MVSPSAALTEAAVDDGGGSCCCCCDDVEDGAYDDRLMLDLEREILRLLLSFL